MKGGGGYIFSLGAKNASFGPKSLVKGVSLLMMPGAKRYRGRSLPPSGNDEICKSNEADLSVFPSVSSY